MSNMFWNMIYNQQAGDSKEFSEYIQKDDIQSILRADRFKQEVQHNTQVQQYLGKPNNVQRLLEYLYDSSSDQARQQLNTAANDAIMSEAGPILDTIASTPQYLLQVFRVLIPFNQDTADYYNTEDLPKIPPIIRRVPLICAENFCRLIFTLIKQQTRFLKVLQFLSQNLQIMLWFAYAIQSAAITETLHYLFKADKNADISTLQTRIIVESRFVPELYSLFDGVGIFEELVHVAFIFQSFLTSELKQEVKWEVLNHLTPVVERVLNNVASVVASEVNTNISTYLKCGIPVQEGTVNSNIQPWCLKSLYTIIAIGIKQLVRHGVMSETVDQAKQSAGCLDVLLDVLIPRIGLFLCLQVRPGVPHAVNLLVSHTASLLGEILKIQEATFDFIKEKEQMLLNHQYKPESAIQYLTQYYKNQPTDQKPMPLVIGFSFIFQDIYIHLHEATQFQFDSQFTKQVQQVHQSSNKQVSAIHLFGPNKEICIGSVEYIAIRFIESGLFNILAIQCYQNPEVSILHYVLLQSIQLLSSYLPFQSNFVQQFINEEFFKQLAAAIRVPLGSPRSQVQRTSLEALAAQCVKIVVEKANSLPDAAQSIAKDLEVKEALGM